MIGPDDAWAVGSNLVDLVPRSLAVHWDGTTWTEVTTPRPPAARELYDVTAISSRDVWAIGSAYENGVDRPIALHWNGFGWRTIAMPRQLGVHPTLWSISGHRHGRVWAVGSTGIPQQTLILRWDGIAWSVSRARTRTLTGTCSSTCWTWSGRRRGRSA